MSKIRIYGDTSGYVDITAPTVADNSAIDISNPTFSGNISANGTITSGVDNNSYMRVGRYSSGYGGSALNTYGGSSFLSMQVEGIEAIRANSSGYVTMPYQPAFTAYDSSGGDVTRTGIIPAANTIINVGNHYNTSNYTFTCPVSGNYLFGWAFYSNNNSLTNSRLFIYKNGSPYIQSGALGSYMPYSALVNCSSNDTITFTTGAYQIAYYASNAHNLVYGYLLG